MKLSIATGVVALVLSGVPSICGQSLGDIARQDRQRRSHLPRHSPVLTNQDLARQRILTPELRQRILAAYAAESLPPPPALDGSALSNTATPFSRMAAAMAPEVALAPLPEIPGPDAVFVAGVEQMPAQSPIAEQGKKLLGEYEPPIAPANSNAEALSLADYAQLRSPHTARDYGFDLEPSNMQPAPVARAERDIPLAEYAQLSSNGTALDNGIDLQVLNVQPSPVLQPENQISLAEHARQLRSQNIIGDNGFEVELLNVPALLVAQAGNEISLGEYARQLRAGRAAADNGFDVEIADVQATPAAQGETEISLGELARQLRAERAAHAQRFTPEPIPVEASAVAQVQEAISLGEYARQLQAVRSVQAFESGSLSPVPPPVSVGELNAEVSLGEYARQARIHRSAEEYSRLLEQGENASPSTGSLLPGELAPSLEGVPIPAPAVMQPVSERVHTAARVVRSARHTPRMVTAAEQIGRLAGHIAVTVRRGDSLWRLAHRYLGSGARWKSLSFLRSHPGSPDLIYAGEVVLIPAPDGNIDAHSAVSSRLGKKPLH